MWVVQEGAGERDEIGFTFSDQPISLVRLRDQADCHDGESGLALDALRKRDLIAWSEDDLLRGIIATR